MPLAELREVVEAEWSDEMLGEEECGGGAEGGGAEQGAVADGAGITALDREGLNKESFALPWHKCSDVGPEVVICV